MIDVHIIGGDTHHVNYNVSKNHIERPMKAAPRIKERYHHGNLRAALVDAGLVLLREGGPGAVTTRACAAIAGVAPSAVFRHFADLRALLTAIAIVGYRTLGSHMVTARKRAAPGAAMSAIGECYLVFARDEPQLFRLMFRADVLDLSDPDLSAASSPLLNETADTSGGQGSLALDRAILAWAVVHGLATLSLDSRLDSRLPPARKQRHESLVRIMRLAEPLFTTE